MPDLICIGPRRSTASTAAHGEKFTQWTRQISPNHFAGGNSRASRTAMVTSSPRRRTPRRTRQSTVPSYAPCARGEKNSSLCEGGWPCGPRGGECRSCRGWGLARSFRGPLSPRHAQSYPSSDRLVQKLGLAWDERAHCPRSTHLPRRARKTCSARPWRTVRRWLRDCLHSTILYDVTIASLSRNSLRPPRKAKPYPWHPVTCR